MTGFYAGLIAWQVFIYLGIKELGFGQVCSPVAVVPPICWYQYYISWNWLPLIIPILWILGVKLGYFLGRWMPFFNQFGRFAAIGFTNFIVYTGILNIFIWRTGIVSGRWYSIFVAVSFIVGTVHSFAWNKYWVFSAESGSASGGPNSGGGTEFGKFITVSIIAGLINVGVASFIVNYIHPILGITPEGWANIGGVAGSAVALIFSFVGFRLLVFKKKSDALSQV